MSKPGCPRKKRKLNDDNDYVACNESKESYKDVNAIGNIIQSFKGPQLKSCLKYLKSLRSIDGKLPFEHLTISGKKSELQQRVKDSISMVYNAEIISSSNKINQETIDFDEWKFDIGQYLNEMVASKKCSKNSTNSVLDELLLSRLAVSDKKQIIQTLELLLNEQQNGSELAKQFNKLLPKANLEPIYSTHDELINAIFKSFPNSRYGSMTDNYCFNRCKDAVIAAKQQILKDTQEIMKSKHWNTCLKYLCVTSRNIKRFPVWDSDFNNKDNEDLKKELKICYEKVQKELGQNLTEIQKKRLKILHEFVL